MIKRWSGLPKEVGESPSLGLVDVVMFGQKLDSMIWRSFATVVIQWNMPYCMALRIKEIYFRVGLCWP